ncbi:hypothetical protein DFP72DRAFT_794857, partial [Ephemerocybe angulata]
EGRGKRARKVNREVVGWIEEVKAYLMNGVDSDEWKRCVEAWCMFETSTVASTNSRLGGSSQRPPIVTKWLKKKNLESVPQIDDLEGYAMEWVAWWNAMQPNERRRDGEVVMLLPMTKEMASAIGCLKKSGSGGISTVLIALSW